MDSPEETLPLRRDRYANVFAGTNSEIRFITWMMHAECSFLSAAALERAATISNLPFSALFLDSFHALPNASITRHSLLMVMVTQLALRLISLVNIFG